MLMGPFFVMFGAMRSGARLILSATALWAMAVGIGLVRPAAWTRADSPVPTVSEALQPSSGCFHPRVWSADP